jgi:DNA-binding CsgD family transcriptional regulator
MSSREDFEHYNRELAALLTRVGSEGFPAGLVSLCRTLVPLEDASIILYPAGGLPLVEYREVPGETGANTLDRFVQGMFLLDPYYSAGRRGDSGLFRLRELAPTGFRDSEYYSNWYRNCGYHDECGYLVPLADGGFVNVAFGRVQQGQRFTDAQVGRLRAAWPVVEQLSRQHWAGNAGRAIGEDLRAQLHLALSDFGSSMLTERESQVINLVLHGHSTRTIADRLSISVETVKLHRKHAYAKLEVSSQAELFYLFLDSLMSASHYAGGDTLIAYMQKPGSE